MDENRQFNAFEEGEMDEFLRKTLEGHRVEPKPGSWKTLSRTLLWREIARFNFKNISTGRLWVAGLAGLLVITSTIYLLLPNSNPTAPSATSSIPLIKPVSTVSTPTLSNQATSSISHQGSSVSNSAAESLTKTKTFNSGLPETTANAVLDENHPLPEPQITLRQDLQSAPVPLSLTEISELSPLESPMLGIQPVSDTIISINTPNGIVKFRKSRQSAEQFFSAGIGIEPEMAFNAQPDVNSTFNFWMSGRMTYHISRFSITSGIGLGYVFDEGKYRIDYQSLDSVGYYNKVVSFTTGANNEIIFNTETKGVYDSLMHMADDRTRNRYTYLQVPLLLGYRLFESNSVSLTFQVGPAVSFLISSHTSDPVINYPNARIIKVEDATPSRITTNWQLWANLNLEIRLNRKISLYIEPACKYYLKPIMEQENVSFKAPWSVGLGVGVQFNFGKK